MKKEAFIKFMEALGWSLDRWGHLQKSITSRLPHVDYPIDREPFVTREYRIKLQATSCRIEIKTHHEATKYSPACSGWTRIGGDYYSKIVQLGDARIRVGVFTFSGNKGTQP